MKGTASQPNHTCRREQGKRSAQAGGPPTAGGVRDRSRMAATCRGAGRSPQSPTAVRRDAQSPTGKLRTPTGRRSNVTPSATRHQNMSPKTHFANTNFFVVRWRKDRQALLDRHRRLHARPCENKKPVATTWVLREAVIRTACATAVYPPVYPRSAKKKNGLAHF